MYVNAIYINTINIHTIYINAIYINTIYINTMYINTIYINTIYIHTRSEERSIIIPRSIQYSQYNIVNIIQVNKLYNKLIQYIIDGTRLKERKIVNNTTFSTK